MPDICTRRSHMFFQRRYIQFSSITHTITDILQDNNQSLYKNPSDQSYPIPSAEIESPLSQ